MLSFVAQSRTDPDRARTSPCESCKGEQQGADATWTTVRSKCGYLVVGSTSDAG
jgi:hypothetical protein